MSKETSTERIFKILNDLNNGRKISLLNIVNEYEVNERTAYRDINLINNTFGNILVKEGDFYSTINKDIFNDILKGKNLATFRILLSLLEKSGININVNNKIKELIKKSNKIYNFNTKLFEEIKNKDFFNLIETAIEYKQKLNINYQGRNNKINILFNPYKIVMLNENFYLLGISENKDYILKISMIEKVILERNTFKTDYKYLDFIEKIQTPFALYGNEKIEVVLKVDKRISKYFKLKKYLLSQKILKTFDDGSLIVKYEITNYKEIFELILKWLPKIEIQKPEGLKEAIRKDLKSKLKKLN